VSVKPRRVTVSIVEAVVLPPAQIDLLALNHSPLNQLYPRSSQYPPV
jgi:hypothetical protein